MAETDDKDDPYQDPVAGLGHLLCDGISVSALATAIEEEGVYSYGRFN